ncbi:hypothetical protein Moror_3266 [Moniliophthora roreri MCA 2997]|uniref:Uncharacterized protein n=1 Tax=Moniliophthora roreri (strain MCA 2997) TaxID=1381753 RepID=V2W8T7_MONRO|nr:hypothetical protein Moror_3266 [Moniliophthora roreri MCA 2997]
MSSIVDSTAILRNIGNDLVKSTVAIAVKGVLITVYSVLVLKAGTILLGNRKRQSARKVPIVTMTVVAIMYLLCLTLSIIDLVLLVAETRITLVKDPEDDLNVKYERARGFMAPRVAAEDLIYSYMTVLGDGVIVWRVYAFWALSNWRIAAMIAPIALLLTSFALSIILTHCVVNLNGSIVLGSFNDPPFCRDVQIVSYATPAATTAIATFLIGIKVWNYLRISRAHGVDDLRLSTRSRAESIIVLLLESGLAYFVFFLAQVILATPAVKDAINLHPGLQFAQTVFSYQSSSIVGMYPTIIICLVHAQRSAIDTMVYSADGSGSSDDGREVTSIAFSSFQTDLNTAREDVESRPKQVDSYVFKAASSSTKLSLGGVIGAATSEWLLDQVVNYSIFWNITYGLSADPHKQMEPTADQNHFHTSYSF